MISGGHTDPHLVTVWSYHGAIWLYGVDASFVVEVLPKKMSTDDQVSLLSFDNEVFRLYAWYATAVTVKMMLMSIYVSQYRLRRKVVFVILVY